MADSDHFIYVISVTKLGIPLAPVKIGITSQVDGRLKALQTASPYPLSLVHTFTVPNKGIAREIERAFHEVQKKHKTSGEWFDLDPMIAVFLMCMNIKVTLHYCTDLESEEMKTALEMCGVDAAYAKLKASADAKKQLTLQ